MVDTEVTITMRFQWGREPTEEEIREQVEEIWLGVLVGHEQEDV